MKTVVDQADRLVLQDSPGFPGVILMGIALGITVAGLGLALEGRWRGLGVAAAGLGIGGLLTVWLGGGSQLVLDSREDTVTLTRRGATGSPGVLTWRLVDLQEAAVEQARGDDGQSARPVLLFADGSRTTVGALHFRGHGAQLTAMTVNRWLQAHRPGAPASHPHSR